MENKRLATGWSLLHQSVGPRSAFSAWKSSSSYLFTLSSPCCRSKLHAAATPLLSSGRTLWV